MRGRKPKPVEMRTGRSHKARNIAPIVAKTPLGSPSAWLSKEEKALWRRLARDLPEGLLRACDRPLWEVYVQNLAELRRIREALAELPMADPVALGLRRLSVSLSATIKSIASEFGLSPSARSRVVAAPVASEEESDFVKFARKRA